MLTSYILGSMDTKEDIPLTSLFHAYLYIGLDKAILFLDSSKINETVTPYLERMNVERRNYTDLWTFLRKKEWGNGKVHIKKQTFFFHLLMVLFLGLLVDPTIVIMCNFIDPHSLLYPRTQQSRVLDVDQERG
jgi:hypothetical protein